jgi:hypothetical protein
MWWMICGALLTMALAFGGLLYWAIKDYWQEMPGLHDLDDARK